MDCITPVAESAVTDLSATDIALLMPPSAAHVSQLLLMRTSIGSSLSNHPRRNQMTPASASSLAVTGWRKRRAGINKERGCLAVTAITGINIRVLRIIEICCENTMSIGDWIRGMVAWDAMNRRGGLRDKVETRGKGLAP